MTRAVVFLALCCVGLCYMGLCWAEPCRAEAQAEPPVDLTIEFASPAYTAGPQILLGDIARVHVLDDALRARLAQMEVGAVRARSTWARCK